MRGGRWGCERPEPGWGAAKRGTGLPRPSRSREGARGALEPERGRGSLRRVPRLTPAARGEGEEAPHATTRGAERRATIG